MATTAATLDQVLDYVHGHADEQEITALYDALNTRRKALNDRRALAVREGLSVRLDGLSPKYLNGLTGTVESISGKRADVRLDEHSTSVLRYAGNKFYVAADVNEYVLHGVPKGCCLPQ